MRNIIGILVAIVLVVVGLGVVRPHTARLIDESWEPVVQGRLELPLADRASVEVSRPGDYVVFIEGPAGDPLWSTVADTWIQLLDWQTGRPLNATRQGVDYSYEVDGRRAQSLSRVGVLRAGIHELSLGRMDSTDFQSRGFQVALSPATLVIEQSRRATSLLVGGIVVGILMAVVALSMLTKRQS